MSATIQLFQPHHSDGIRDLIVPIQRDEFDIPITWAEQTDLHDIPAHYDGGAGAFWVAVDDGAVVGTIALVDIGGGLGALRKMFVRQSHRGREKGVAADLLATLLGHARDTGLQAVYLGTTVKFLAAHRFYEKNGFSALSAEDLPPSFPRMAVDTVFYRINL